MSSSITSGTAGLGTLDFVRPASIATALDSQVVMAFEDNRAVAASIEGSQAEQEQATASVEGSRASAEGSQVAHKALQGLATIVAVFFVQLQRRPSSALLSSVLFAHHLGRYLHMPKHIE